MGFEPTLPMPRRISTRTQTSIGLVHNRASTPDEVRDMARHLHRFVFFPVFLVSAFSQMADLASARPGFWRMPSCCRYCRLHLPPKDRGARAQTVCEADHAQRSKAVGHPTPMMGSPRQSAGTVQAAAPAHRSQTNRRRNDPGGRDPWAWCVRCDRRMESVRIRETRETPRHRRSWPPAVFWSA